MRWKLFLEELWLEVNSHEFLVNRIGKFLNIDLSTSLSYMTIICKFLSLVSKVFKETVANDSLMQI